MTTERKLDIFRVLAAADAKDIDFLSKLSQDEIKALQPFLVMRWMSGTPSALQIMMINEVLNPYAFSLATHKELLWQLLVAANSGRKQRYVWNKLPAKATTSKPVSVKVLREYYHYSTADAVDAANVLTKVDILDLAEELGYQPEDLTKIRREYKDDSDESTKRGKQKHPADDLLSY